MLAALDVDYNSERTCASCILFEHWHSAEPVAQHVARSDPSDAADYVPGEFYKRELPALLRVLEHVEVASLEALVIDGYVWLGRSRPGMGYRLFEALHGTVAVIGVAKNPFADNDVALPLVRGESKKPLFVTAAGCDARDAVSFIGRMHGPNRIPTLLRLADQLCRRG